MQIADMRNLGPVTARRLAEIGITTDAELRALGPETAWRRLRFTFGREVTLNALYALEGAISGQDWRDLAPETRERLRRIAAGS